MKAFCDNHLPVKIYNFTYEDILYTTDTIKPSLLAFLTQLFHYFVIKPLDFVSPILAANNNDYSQGMLYSAVCSDLFSASSRFKQLDNSI